MTEGTGRSGRGPSFVVHAAAAIILGLTFANLLFNAIAASSGAAYPYTSFLFDPRDRFADFFKLVFSYPGAPVHAAASFWHLDALLNHHWFDVRRFEGTYFNHFHVPPLPTLLALAARALVRWVDPVAVFVILLISALVAQFTTLLRVAPKGRLGATLATVTVLSYPTLLFIDRGHFFSLICGTALIAASLRTLRDGRCDGWSIFLFAVAMNIRPNAAIIPLALFLGKRGVDFGEGVALGAVSIAMFTACLWIAHAIYPAYSLDSFLSGLTDYGNVYVVGLNGFPGGSSLYGAFRALFHFGTWMYLPPLIVAGLLFAPAIIESRHDRMRKSECLFLVLSAYALGTHVFADYHLIVFVIPLVLLVRERMQDRSSWAVLLGTSLILAPKNFIFATGHGDWSLQIVANPMILMAASATVIVTAIRRSKAGTPAQAIPAAA